MRPPRSVNARDPLLLLGLVTLIAGTLLSPLPADPDVPMGLAHRLGTLALFVFWTSGLVAWGGLAARRLTGARPTLGTALAAGAAVESLLALGLGYLGVLGPGHRWLFLILTFAPLVAKAALHEPTPALPEAFARSRRPRREALLALEPLALLAVAAVVVLAALAAAVPGAYSDPLFYHLVGPWLWSAGGRIHFPPTFPVLLHCSYWEQLFLWAQPLVAGGGSDGLIEFQLFCQWSSALVGFAGSALLLAELAAALGASRLGQRVAALAGLSVPALSFAAGLAMNDWGATLWTLAGVLALTRGEAALAGLLLGLAFAGKYMTILTIGPAVVWWAWTLPKRARAHGLATVGLWAAAVFAPLALRNLIVAGNPVFPLFDGLFHSRLMTPFFERQIHEAISPLGADLVPLLLQRLWLLARQSPVVLALPAAVGALALRGGRAALRGPRALLLVPLAAFALFTATVGRPLGGDDGTLHLRWLGPGLALAAAFAAVALEACLKPAFAPLALGALGALALLHPPPPPLALLRSDPAVVIRETQVGGRLKAWLRLHADPGALILSSGDNQIYYLLGHPVRVVNSDPELAALDERARDDVPAAELLPALKATGGRYLLITRHFQQRYWNELTRVLDAAVHQNPRSILFLDADGYVVDLRTL